MPPTTAKRSKPIDVRAMKDRAHALVRSGRFAAALDAYAALIANDADDASLRLHQGELLAKLDRFPQSVAAYRTAARLFQAQGHTARARAALKNALAISPLDTELLAELRGLAPSASPPSLPVPRLRLVKPPPPVPEDEILDSGEPLDDEVVLDSVILGEDLFDALPERPQKPEELTALLPPLERTQKPEELTALLPPISPSPPPRRREAAPAPKERAAERSRREREAREAARREETRREEARREEARREEARSKARALKARRAQLQAEYAELLQADLAEAEHATDSYIPIFDFLDAERAALEARNRRDVTASHPDRAALVEARRSSTRTLRGRRSPR